MADPKIGEMVLYDYIRPPLLAGEYRMRVQTDVSVPGTATPLPGQDFFFNVEGPRFALSPNEVAGVFPPRGGHGPFDSALPHVALGRRTLPWERPLGDAYTVAGDQQPYPFLALVLLEQSECTILRNQALTDIVPADVFTRLGRPTGVRCDAVEADAQLLHEILPMPEELQLLTHVRQVNVEDRELSAGDSDGYFAVVMGNRIPRPGGDYVACLVSVEERTDLLPVTDLVDSGPKGDVWANPEIDHVYRPSDAVPSSIGTQISPHEADRIRISPPGAEPAGPGLPGGVADLVTGPGLDARRTDNGVGATVDGRSDAVRATGPASSFTQVAAVSQSSSVVKFGAAQQTARAKEFIAVEVGSGASKAGGLLLHPKARLVLLHSWTFSVEGEGTFRQLMQGLDVGMMGDVSPESKLKVADTGHMLVDVVDRLGAAEQSWYRGPLVGEPLTRDPLGPYHSADQARRVVAESGIENISYAAAFETGRLLAAADGRLAQELMRWRRGSFRASARHTSITLLKQKLRLTAVEDPLDPVALHYTVDVLQKITDGIIAPADPHGLDLALAGPLLQPEVVAKAFGLETTEQALSLLGHDVALSGPITVQAPERALSTLEAVLSDRAGMAALAEVRARAIEAVTRTGDPGRQNRLLRDHPARPQGQEDRR
ncbi:hypothetical protein AB0I54_20740 [Streptomyces sp. NPDC050625]|uniref:hypothetical protein n=1 Tax=Streptomyces sp. NPDC050625 TaxID=3154629 RepID=UPI00343E8093